MFSGICKSDHMPDLPSLNRKTEMTHQSSLLTTTLMVIFTLKKNHNITKGFETLRSRIGKTSDKIRVIVLSSDVYRT